MSLKDFRNDLLDQLLRFLWRQWSTLGVLGQSGTEDEWALDSEALLIFSLQIARYEPRLFDEIQSWLITNGHWMDASRLRRMLSGRELIEERIVGATLQVALQQSNEIKWKNLTLQLQKKIREMQDKPASLSYQILRQQPTSGFVEPLFKEKSGEFHPLVLDGKADPYFQLFFINRPEIKNLKESGEVPVNSKTNIRFLLRSLFGVGSRAEILLYLLTHEGGHPRDIAESIGLFWLGVQQTLVDMANSGLVSKKPKGKRVEYWVSHKKWWDFLSFSGEDIGSRPKWLNWMAIFSALWTIWKSVDELSRTEASDYMKSSKLQDSLEILHGEFSRAGLDVPALPTQAIPSDLHQQTTLQFLNKVLG